MIEHYSNNIQNVIQRELFNSRVSIKVVVAWFTNNLLFQPLLLKLMSGVSVELILNKDDINLSSENEIDFDLFVQHGGRIHWNTTPKLMHDKFCIIDDNLVISGSYNWTNKAEYNDESISLFRDEPATIKFYNDSFNRLTLQYPVSIECNTTRYFRINKEHCPIRQAPYTKLHFYNSVQIRTTYHHTFIFANEYEGGLYALLDNQSFLPKTEYMFGEIPWYCSLYDKDEEETIWLKGETSWGLFDCRKLKYIVLPQFDDVKMRTEDSNYHFVLYKGKYGAYNCNGEKILECRYDELYNLSRRAIRTKLNNKFGLLYASGNKSIIPCDYDSVRYLSEDSFILEKNGKYAVTYKGEMVTPYFFDEYDKLYSSSIIVRMNGKYGLICDDRQVLKCEFDELKIGQPTIHNGKYGLVLSDGTIALEFIYDKIESYKGRFYVIKDGKYGIYNKKHQRIGNYWTDSVEAIHRYIDSETYEFTYMSPINYKNFI